MTTEQRWLNDDEFIFVVCNVPFINEPGTQVDRFGRPSKVIYKKGEIEELIRQGKSHGTIDDLQTKEERELVEEV